MIRLDRGADRNHRNILDCGGFHLAAQAVQAVIELLHHEWQVADGDVVVRQECRCDIGSQRYHLVSIHFAHSN